MKKYKVEPIVYIKKNEIVKVAFIIKKRVFLIFWKTISTDFKTETEARTICDGLNKNTKK